MYYESIVAPFDFFFVNICIICMAMLLLMVRDCDRQCAFSIPRDRENQFQSYFFVVFCSLSLPLRANVNVRLS